ncbi:MAG TPA: RcpC/CpaB family pilus assembly protein, partial [Chloroflexota bacterium]|nr:RcpC/CpaB family pilus assembly protein [Chloroflexota bacterium]
MATTLSPARALRQPRRIDWRALFGIFLTLVAVGGSIFFWTASSDTRSVVVATRDVPSGSSLTLADLAVARVRIDDTLYQAAVPAEDLSTLAGKQLAEPVHAHQVIVRAQISPRPSLGRDQLALTIPISPETAVGGSLRPGDAVEVLVTINKGKPEARTTVVL